MGLAERAIEKRRRQLEKRGAKQKSAVTGDAGSKKPSRKERAKKTKHNLKQAEKARDKYSKGKEVLTSTLLSNGVLETGVLREVETPDGYIDSLECYTLKEAGIALGRTLLTIRNWIESEMFPKTQLVDTVYRYNQYSRGELDVIAEILDEHFKVNPQLQRSHVDTKSKLFSAIEEYREEFI